MRHLVCSVLFARAPLVPILRTLPASVAQLDAGQTGDQEVVGSILVGYHSFMEFDHEMFSMVILFLPLIQEGQLLISVERICTNTG